MSVCPAQMKRAISAAWHAAVERSEELGEFVVTLGCRRHTSICDFCGFRAETRAGLAAHLVFRHEIRWAAPRIGPITICPCCDVQFHTRARLQYHLRKTAKYCLDFVRSEGLLIDKATAAALDRDESLRLRKTRARAVEDVLPVCTGAAGDTVAPVSDLVEAEIFLEDIL